MESAPQPVQPVPAPKKRGKMKTLGIGCLGVIGFFVVIAIIGALTGGDDKNDSSSVANAPAPTATSRPATTTAQQAVQPAATTAKPTPTAKPEPTPTPPTYAWGANKEDVHIELKDGAIGEVAEPGSKARHKVTITKITDNAASTNQFQKPAAGNKYWVAQVLIENTGTAEMGTGSWKMRTNDDFEHDRAFAAGLGETLQALQNLTPGAKTQGVIIFEVPEGATPRFLRYDPNVFAKGDLYFDGESPIKQ